MKISKPVIRRRVLRFARQMKELIAAKRWWNAYRCDCRPVDLGAELVALLLARRLVAALDRDDEGEAKRVAKRMDELADMVEGRMR